MIYWNSPSIPDITDIEKETFYGIAFGKGYREIAQERNVSEVTIKATCDRVQNRLWLPNNLSVLRELILKWVLLFPFWASKEIILTQKERDALVFLSKWYKQSQGQEILGITTSGLKLRLQEIHRKYQVSTNEAALVEALLRWDITEDDISTSYQKESIV